MSGEAARTAAAKALATLRGLAAALVVDADGSGWPAELARDLDEAAAYHACRLPSLTALRLLREGVAELHGLAIERRPEWLPQASAGHHLLDLAISMAGGVPDLIDDDLDWAPDEADDTLPPSEWTLLAIDGAIPLARDLAESTSRMPPSTCRADLDRMLGLALALRCALRTPGPWRASPLRQGFEEAGLAAARTRATLSGLPGLGDQAALAAHLQEVFESPLPSPSGPGPG